MVNGGGVGMWSSAQAPFTEESEWPMVCVILLRCDARFEEPRDRKREAIWDRKMAKIDSPSQRDSRMILSISQLIASHQLHLLHDTEAMQTALQAKIAVTTLCHVMTARMGGG
jgi:hypothetical protein